MGMVQLANSLGRPTAAPLGAFLLEKTGFVGVTSASLSGAVIGCLFLFVRMRSFKWHPPASKSASRHAFSLYHVKDALVVTFKKRPKPNRKYLYLLMFMTINQSIPFYGEYNIAYLFVRTVFGWEVEEYSKYTSITSILHIASQSILIPALALLKVRDSTVCIMVLSTTVLKHVIKGLSKEGWMFYLGILFVLHRFNKNQNGPSAGSLMGLSMGPSSTKSQSSNF